MHSYVLQQDEDENALQPPQPVLQNIQNNYIGPRFDVACTHVTTADGHKLPWVSEIRYLGTFIVAGRQVRCSIAHAKRSFHRALNAIFGKIGRLASEEVTLELVKRKCMPILLYGLECYTLLKADIRSPDLYTVFDETLQVNEY